MMNKKGSSTLTLICLAMIVILILIEIIIVGNHSKEIQNAGCNYCEFGKATDYKKLKPNSLFGNDLLVECNNYQIIKMTYEQIDCEYNKWDQCIPVKDWKIECNWGANTK